MAATSEPKNVSTKLQRIAGLAREAPDMALTTLAHHMDLDFLKEAYRRTRKDGAPGVDGQLADEYGGNLDSNLLSLLERFKSGTYRAPPVRRVHIPKGDGTRTRPIGVPTFEDKVMQRAVTMILEAIYEQDFLDCSYGFRPGRSAHQAVDALWTGMTKIAGGVVIELDIESFYDTIDHGRLRSFLDQRVRDGVLRRMIDKWLKAGVLEKGKVSHSETGTPQGGVASPILANIYLHEVLDRWFEEQVKPRLDGKSFLVRYADDAVLVFSSENDARRVFEVLPKRFARFGLTLHREKTRMVSFRRPRPDAGNRMEGRATKPGSLDFLGFTHFWGRARQGKWIIKRKTASSRFSRAVRRIALWCRKHRHQSIEEQHRSLVAKLRGHYGYYGITGNGWQISAFRTRVSEIWRKWLDRRSQRSRMSWEKFRRVLQRFPLPPAVAIHSVCRLVAKP